MNDFIEVHVHGERHLVNLRSVEDILDMGKDGTAIYFTFSAPDAVYQDRIFTDETYEEVRRMIWR